MNTAFSTYFNATNVGGTPRFTTRDCVQIAIAGLERNYFNPKTVAIGLTDNSFFVFEANRCTILAPPEHIRTKYPDSITALGRWTMRFVYNEDLSFIHIEKNKPTLPHHGHFFYNDRAAIDKMIEISKSWK